MPAKKYNHSKNKTRSQSVIASELLAGEGIWITGDLAIGSGVLRELPLSFLWTPGEWGLGKQN